MKALVSPQLKPMTTRNGRAGAGLSAEVSHLCDTRVPPPAHKQEPGF